MQTFQQTSDEPYLRHHYKLVWEDGDWITVDNYQDVHQLWHQYPGATHVEVLDIPQKSKGFI
jgi:hypothetical protein